MRIIGFVTAAIGLMMLAVGLDADAPLERVSEALTGATPIPPCGT
ncbi:MAG TPA: hypothetical protein VF342_01760 [Alphaproteobacteria bacterium]